MDDKRFKLEDWQVEVLHTLRRVLSLSHEQCAKLCWARWGIEITRLGVRKRMEQSTTGDHSMKKCRELDAIFGKGFVDSRMIGKQQNLF